MLNLDKLHKHLTQPIAAYQRYGKTVHTPDGIYIYQNNSADTNINVLMVAHLDIAITPPKHSLDDSLIVSAALDDRLGVYTILEELPEYLDYDVLLTTGEEKGLSTARYFEPAHSYKWVFEFDRRGKDVVMYHYKNKEATTILRQAHFQVGQGSYTDICDLTHLNTMAFNFGIGYYDEHTPYCYVEPAIWQQQVKKFLDFYWINKDKPIVPTFDNYDYEDTYWLEDERDNPIEPTLCPYCWQHTIEEWEICCFRCAFELDDWN